LQKENNNIRPKFQELVAFKITAERKIHELKEEMIRADIGDPNSHSFKGQEPSSNKRLDEYKSKINDLEEQLHTYKSRERDMTDKLDKFRSDLDSAN